MQKLFDWILINKFKTTLIILVIFLIPLFVANIMFTIPAFNEFFAAEWEAGDFLSYCGAFLSFFGTILLGALALYQNDKLNKINNNLMHNQYKPIITVSHIVDETKEDEKERTFYRSIQRNSENILVNTGWSSQPTYSPYAKLKFSNIGLGAAINIRIYWYELKKIDGLSSLDKIRETNIENFYDRIIYSPFKYIDLDEIKCEPWLIYTEFDLGVSEETNKINLLFSFEENVASFHSIIEITYENLIGICFGRKLYLGYDEKGPFILPASREYKISQIRCE